MSNLYKKAAERKKVVPGGVQGPQEEAKSEEVVTTPAEPENAQAPAQEAVVAPSPASEPDVKPEGSAEVDAVTIMLEEIEAAKKPKKRSSTLYLSDDVLNELRKRGKKVGMSSSEYLDALLKKAFGL